MELLTFCSSFNFLASGDDQLLIDDPSGTLAEAAFHRLRNDLVKCRFKPGEKLRVQELRGEYGIGSGPLREALSRLAATGLVVAQGQRGFRAAPVSTTELLNLTKTRICVEAIALRLALRLGDLNWEAEVVAAGHRLGLGEGRDASHLFYLDDAWEAKHRAFHAAILSGCGNGSLTELCASLYELAQRYRYLIIANMPPERNVHAEHMALQRAVLARDADETVRVILEHNVAATQTILNADPAAAGQADRLIAQMRSHVAVGLALDLGLGSPEASNLPARQSSTLGRRAAARSPRSRKRL
jgi:DNA-binding GntR family transcriptional regulator